MTVKWMHEIRDPIHVFITLDSNERKVLDSRPFQRLRYIHQLATTYLVYPGATHRRFEHSLGVMELASRVYDVVTNQASLVDDSVRGIVPSQQSLEHQYWRRVLRMAALCHDLGHLPFSHAAESALLPVGWSHEQLTEALIMSPEMEAIWRDLKIHASHVAMLAVGPKHYKDGKGTTEFTDWETILSEVITGDAFGVDRMDYLLRDSHHTGVAYGKFDHYRLIDTLRILPRQQVGSREPTLGVEEGGLHSAEALLLARYFMFQQLYFHPVRRIYDIHLKDFLKEWLPSGMFSTDIEEHLKMTDDRVLVGIREAAADVYHPACVHAIRLLERKHFKLLYERSARDTKINPAAGEAVYKAVSDRYGSSFVRHDAYTEKNVNLDFPVLMRDDNIGSSLAESRVLEHIPVAGFDYVFVCRECFDGAEAWLKRELNKIISL